MTILNNIVLCLHGVTNIEDPASEKTFDTRNIEGDLVYDDQGAVEKTTAVVDQYFNEISEQVPTLYTEKTADIKAQLLHLRSLGYQFVTPNQYIDWWKGVWQPSNPICCVMYDDALSSLKYIVPWHIEQSIPMAIAIISQRQGLRYPEDGFLPYKQMRNWVNQSNGLITVMCHTHDLHHTNLQQEDAVNLDGTFVANNVVESPILEGPWWVDDGDYIYIPDVNKQKHYFASSFISHTYGIPLIGVDPYDGTSLVTTSFKVKTKVTKNAVDLIRIRVSRTIPYSAGYPVHLRITIIKPGATIVAFDGIYEPTDFGNVIQWPEQQFAAFHLTTPFDMVAGENIQVKFETLSGDPNGPLWLAYGLIPHSTDFSTNTTCKGLSRAGSQGYPNKYYQYSDFMPGEEWPVMPMMILATQNGHNVTQQEWKDYINADFTEAQNQITNNFVEDWNVQTLWEGYFDNWNPDWGGVFANDKQVWNPSDDEDPGYQLVGWHKPKLISAEIWLAGKSTNVTLGYITIGVGDRIPSEKAGSAWFKPSQPPVYAENGTRLDNFDGAQIRDFSFNFIIEYSLDNKATWTKIAEVPMYKVKNGDLADINVNNLVLPTTGMWLRLTPSNRGPLSGADQYTVYIIEWIKGATRTAPPASKHSPYVSLAWPFGAYQANWIHDDYPQWYGDAVNKDWLDVSNDMRDILANHGITHAFTINPLRNLPHHGDDISWEQRFSDYMLSRFMVLGTTANEVTINNLDFYTGQMIPNTLHNGTKWQVSLEGDHLGHGTVKRKVHIIDYFAFDAWAFSGGTEGYPLYSIVKTTAPINDGSYFPGFDGDPSDGGGYYADERTWIQQRGGKALIIINNNLGTGEPASDLGKHVFDHPDEYIANMVADALAGGWDGITCNIEGVEVDGAEEYIGKAVEFYKRLGRACHENNLLLHCTAPARTGNTNYDWPGWVDWCDHAEIIKHVDGMKIMSYTESNEGSEPRPGAWDTAPLTYYDNSVPPDPRSFWKAVVDYTNQVIPVQYRCRLLMGGRAFGHIWYPNWLGNDINNVPQVIREAEGFDINNPYFKYSNSFGVEKIGGENEYITYTGFMEQCLVESNLIQQNLAIDSTEITFLNPHTEVTSWMGSPLTLARSIKTALENGYGGCGIWKIDDGDINQYYPETRMFGRSTPLRYKK